MNAHTPGLSPIPPAGAVPILCVLLALATCGVVLRAWRVGNALITGFERNPYRMLPLAGLCGVLLAVLILVAMHSASRRHLLPLMVAAMAAALLDLFCALRWLPMEPVAWPFSADILVRHHLVLSRPGITYPIVLILLTLAATSASRHRQHASRQAVILASIALGIALMAGSLIPLGIVTPDGTGRRALISLPGTITTVALSIALLGWQFRAGWPELPWNRESRPLYAALAACVLSPALFALVRLWAVHIAMISPELADVLCVGAQTIILVTILFRAWSRISHENAARQELAHALDAAPIILTNLRGEILHWSMGCERLYQWPAREAIGQIKHELLRAAPCERWETMLDRLRGGLPCEKEIVEHRRDGAPLFVLEHMQLIEGVAERAPVIIFSMTDITERTRAEEALRARESELQSILRTVPDAMITFDEQGRIRSFSAAAEHLCGYRADELIGKPVEQLIPARLQDEHERMFRRYLDHGEPYLVGITQRVRIVHRTGVEILVELAVGEARLGEQRLFIGFLRDLSERLAGEARMAELREELVHVSRLSAMGEMAAGLAHELNQPLAATTNFLGAADLALATQNDDHARELMHLAATQALRAGDIIRRMRNFVTRGKVEVREEPLADLLSEAVDLILTRNGRQRASVRFQLAPELPRIMADRVQIQQVVVNLIRNAVEAAAEHPAHRPEILIQSRCAAAGMVEITVQDNGPGIAPEILSRWPEPFLSAKEDGMGIGLSICRRIIEAHGGVLNVSNQAAGGARVRFTVPAARGEDMVGP